MDFESALLSLVEEDNPLTRGLVAMLSCPTRAESEAFAACWSQIGLLRKRKIIEWMVELAEETFELDYVALFRHCLHDADPVVRRHAIEGLWEYESADLIEPLLKLLASDSDPGVRAAAASSLGRFVFQAECDELDQSRGALIRQVLERTIEGEDEDLQVVRRAIESVAYINDDRVRRIIDQAYDHNDSRMRQSAVFAMGRSADPFWAETVLAELYADWSAMRYEAARACGELEIERAVGRLIDLALDPDRKVQSMAVWALGQIGGDRSREALERLVESADEMLSTMASDALDEMELLTLPLDLFVHTLEDADLTETQFMKGDNPDQAGDYGADRQADGAWEGDFIDLC